MSHFHQHREFFNMPILLTEEELKNPLLVLDCFFTDYNLSEIREMNQDADKLCLTTDDPPFDDATTRDSIILYRKSEERLLEAAYLLFKRKIPADTPPNPDPSKEADTQDSGEMTNLVKMLTDIEVELTDLSKTLETGTGIDSSSTRSPYPADREIRTELPSAELPYQLNLLLKTILDLQLKLGKAILAALSVWPKH